MLGKIKRFSGLSAHNKFEACFSNDDFARAVNLFSMGPSARKAEVGLRIYNDFWDLHNLTGILITSIYHKKI